ncbi:putative transcriptional regulator [Acinetobacter phage BUCT629]|nr:putative transcriptional regulator [Acinetobacter phage BUCT629]
MKFESFYIECKNKDQRNELSKHLEDIGFKYIESEDFDLTIGCYDSGTYQYLNHNQKYGIPTYDFEYFMKNHMSEMIKKIHQAKKELGLNNSELSLKMGKSRPYIAKMLNQPQSEKVQNKVIKEIDELLEFEKLCKEKEYAKVMSGKTEITIENNSKEVEISALKKIIESKDLAISGLVKQNDEAKKIHDKDINTLVEVEGNLIGAKIDLDRTKVELDYFVNQYKQSESDVAGLKSKIKRERIIILIVIAILTALFFLKGSIGG